MKTHSLSELKKIIKNSKNNAPLEWKKTLKVISVQNYINYIYNLNINGFREKSVVNDGLAKHFP